jgi:hypothetical protein
MAKLDVVSDKSLYGGDIWLAGEQRSPLAQDQGSGAASVSGACGLVAGQVDDAKASWVLLAAARHPVDVRESPRERYELRLAATTASWRLARRT